MCVSDNRKSCMIVSYFAKNSVLCLFLVFIFSLMYVYSVSVSDSLGDVRVTSG